MDPRLSKTVIEARRDAVVQAERDAMEAEAERARERERRLHPRSAADFEVLYNELEAWRLQEVRRIRAAGLTPADEQTAMRQLLHKV